MPNGRALSKSLVHRVPIHDVPPRGEVVGTAILIFEVVGVFPHVDAEEGLLPFHERTILVGSALDDELAAGIDQPSPAAAEALHAGVIELRLELLEVAERRLDGVGDRPAWRAALARP